MDAVVRWATGAMEEGGLADLLAVMLIENLFPPIPSEAVLPLAGVLVDRGTYGLLAASAASTASTVIGAWVIYGLGRYGGRPLVLRFRTVLRYSEEDLDRADDWFAESFFATLKVELVGRSRWRSRAHARMAIFGGSAATTPDGVTPLAATCHHSSTNSRGSSPLR